MRKTLISCEDKTSSEIQALGRFKKNKTKLTDSEDLDAVLHPVVSSTRLFQHAHHHYFRSRQHKTQQRRNN